MHLLPQNQKQIYPKQFIKDVLINEIGDIKIKHPFLSFILICSGIEFLGKCIDVDSKNWDEGGKSEKQFKKSILELFPSKYNNIADDLYKELRCGMTHMFSPKAKVALTQKANDRADKIKIENHPFLEPSGKIVLTVEYFFMDFVEACKKVLDKKFSIENKMSKPFLNISF